MKKNILTLFLLLAVFFGFVYFFGSEQTSRIETFEVRGYSLGSYIENGDTISADFGYYAENDIDRGDIVLYDFAGRDNLVAKIVYAIPGDRFELFGVGEKKSLLVNDIALTTSGGEVFEFSGDREELLEKYVSDYEGIVPGGAYLIFGDRVDALGSGDFGLVSERDIVAKIILPSG